MTLLITLFGLACQPPNASELFVNVDVQPAFDVAEANERMTAVIDAADHNVEVALPGLTDPGLTEALLAAHDRGVAVRAIFDVDQAEDAGVVALTEAEVPLRLADGEVTFFDFSLGVDIGWSSVQASMTNAFVIADTYAWVIATRAGDTAPGVVAFFDGHGEEIAEHLWQEHNQIFGGTDATAQNAYNAAAKSITDPRVRWPTQTAEMFEIHFGPQERLIKSIIDGVYNARSDIRILTEDLSDEGLARALQQKADDGFDIEVMVGASFGSTQAALSDILRTQTPDVAKVQSTDPAPLPTLVFLDFGRARDGSFHRPRVLALSHAIVSAARIFNGGPVTTDQLYDGTLIDWSMQGSPSASQQALADIYRDLRATAEEL